MRTAVFFDHRKVEDLQNGFREDKVSCITHNKHLK